MYVWLKLPFLLLSNCCSIQRSAGAICSSSSLVSAQVSVLSAWPLELVPRVSRQLQPVHPSDALSPPEAGREGGPVLLAPRWRRSRPHILVATPHPSRKTSTNMEVEMCSENGTRQPKWPMHVRVKMMEEPRRHNRQLTVPSASHHRPVCFNQTHRQLHQ